MKRILSFFIAAVMIFTSFGKLVFAENEELLNDGLIESTADGKVTDGKWNPGTGSWKGGYGTTVDVITDNVSPNGNSTKSVKIINAALQQGVLGFQENKKYTLTFDIYLETPLLEFGFYKSNEVVAGYSNGIIGSVTGFEVQQLNVWQTVTIDYTAIGDGTHIIEFYNTSKSKELAIYIDNVSLVCTGTDESAGGISVDYNLPSDLQYDFKGKLLNVSRGGHLVINNLNLIPSYYDKFDEDGIRMVRMDWILSDIYYNVVSVGANGKLQYDFTYLDNAIIPLLERGIKPYMCMTRFPSAIGGNTLGELPNPTDEQIAQLGDIIEAVVQHYKDLGYTGWYWESHNEPENNKYYVGNPETVSKEYGVFAKAVKKIDTTAKVGGIGFRNATFSDGTWKPTFFQYIKDNPDIPLDFISIHVYNQMTSFSDAAGFKSHMTEYGIDVPIIYSEWNYDWDSNAGDQTDTNFNAAYGARRMFTAIANDNVSHIFYFTPVDAWIPSNIVSGDNGMYTIDGHRKSAANMFAMYDDLEDTLLQSKSDLQLHTNSSAYGLVTKNDKTKRVTAILYNSAGSGKRLDVNIKNLPYDGNVKITTSLINQNSGNYYQDYLDGFAAYKETPNEKPDTYTEIRESFSEYRETIEMEPYSVIEIVIEPTEEAVRAKTLNEKPAPQINLARGKNITSSSNDTSVEGKDLKNHDILWGADKLTDGYCMSFDMVDDGDTNMGYRSEGFLSSDNTVTITADLGKETEFNTVKLYPINNKTHGGKGMPIDFTIDVSSDGTEWKTVYTETDFNNNGNLDVKNIIFNVTNARYIRLNATKLSEDNGEYRLQLTEIEVFDNSYENISILDGVTCISDGNSIVTDKEVRVLKAVYDKSGTLEAVKIEKGIQFEIENLSKQTVIYVWINEMQPVTKAISLKE